MLTINEAMQRNNMNGVIMRRENNASTSWIVTLIEWTTLQRHKYRYITDDLEDGVLQGANLRINAQKYV